MKHWFDKDQIQKYGADMTYRYILHAIEFNKHKYTYKYQNALNLLLIDTFIINIMKSFNCQTQFDIFKHFKNINMIDYIFKYGMSHFAGCGSYSSLWKLRPLLIEYMCNEYSEALI